jgi:hypothetical protein
VAHASRSIYADHVRSIFGRSGVPLLGPGVRSCAVRRAGQNSSIRNTTATMEPASQVLAQTAPIDVPTDWATLVETEEEIPYHTRYYRKRGRPSMKEKAQSQQYLTPSEEKALVAFILRMSAVGTPIRIKYIPALAFCIASRRATKRPSEPPKKNWPQAFRRRHPQLNRGTIGLCRGSVTIIAYTIR